MTPSWPSFRIHHCPVSKSLGPYTHYIYIYVYVNMPEVYCVDKVNQMILPLSVSYENQQTVRPWIDKLHFAPVGIS